MKRTTLGILFFFCMSCSYVTAIQYPYSLKLQVSLLTIAPGDQFFLLSKRRSNFVRKYFLAASIVAALLIVCWAFLPQQINSALVPIVLSIALCGWRIYTPRKIICLRRGIKKEVL